MCVHGILVKSVKGEWLTEVIQRCQRFFFIIITILTLVYGILHCFFRCVTWLQILQNGFKSHTRLDFRRTLSPRAHFPSTSWYSNLKSHWPQPSIKFTNPVIQLFMLPHVWPGWGHVYTEKSCPGCKSHSPTGATLPGKPYKTWRMVIHEKQKVGSVSTVGLRSSRPKVITPEVVSPETRVMSPEIFSQVARNFILLSNIFASLYLPAQSSPSKLGQPFSTGWPSRAYMRVKPESHACLTDC